jgi:hypothetical protein
MSSDDPALALVDAFVLPERRARLRGLLTSTKGRAKFRAGLAHFRDLDPRYASPIPAGVQTPSQIAALLRDRGAPATCYVLSEESDLDGREFPLTEALERVVGRGMGTFLSCVPGRLAYFEGEETNERYVLDRAG